MSTRTIPGPWTARKDEPEDVWLFITAPDPDDPSREVVIADTVYEDVAPLIVAAPALAAALRACVEHHDQFMIGVIGEEFHRQYGDAPAIAEARRVLSEIEGE